MTKEDKLHEIEKDAIRNMIRKQKIVIVKRCGSNSS